MEAVVDVEAPANVRWVGVTISMARCSSAWHRKRNARGKCLFGSAAPANELLPLWRNCTRCRKDQETWEAVGDCLYWADRGYEAKSPTNTCRPSCVAAAFLAVEACRLSLSARWALAIPSNAKKRYSAAIAYETKRLQRPSCRAERASHSFCRSLSCSPHCKWDRRRAEDPDLPKVNFQASFAVSNAEWRKKSDREDADEQRRNNSRAAPR